MIAQSIAKNVLQAALSTGGDFAELFIEHKRTNNLSVINGKLDRAMSGIDYGLGLRIFNGFGAIYAYTNDLSESSLLRMAASAAAAIHSDKRLTVLDFTQTRPTNLHPVAIPFAGVAKNDVIDLLKQAGKVSHAVSENITQTSGTYLDALQDICVINSEGLWVEDTRAHTRVMLSAVAGNELEKQTGTQSPGAHAGYEFIQGLDTTHLAQESARIALTMLDAGYAPAGKMPVIINKGFGGVLFHEACGHSLEATAIAKGASEFTGKKGQQIASTVVTAIDDATLPNHWGSANIDDEGTPTQRNVLIKDGILNTYLVDRLNGLKMGEPSTGSSRRQSYKFAPTSRMSNTFIQAGESTEAEIIANTEYGLYCATMGGGSVMPTTGDYNFGVNEAYMIRGGKIAEPVRGASLIGRGSETLMAIDMVGNHETQGQGMCGSVSGSIPANCGQPMIRVKEMIVGGRN